MTSILDRLFPPAQCDHGVHIIGADPEYPFLRPRLIMPVLDDEGEVA